MDSIGLGATAIGDVGGAYSQNLKSPREWKAAIERGELPVARGWKRSLDDDIRRAVIQSLMCRFGLSFRELSNSFGIEHHSYFASCLPALEDQAREGLIELDPNGITVTPLGRLFVRNVAMIYDAHLPGMKQAFSATV